LQCFTEPHPAGVGFYVVLLHWLDRSAVSRFRAMTIFRLCDGVAYPDWPQRLIQTGHREADAIGTARPE